jgi:hypothetical protein
LLSRNIKTTDQRETQKEIVYSKILVDMAAEIANCPSFSYGNTNDESNSRENNHS